MPVSNPQSTQPAQEPESSTRHSPSSEMNRPPSVPNTPPRQGFAPVLENPRFVILWIGQIFSQLADKIYLVLMIALIAGHFQAEGQPISGWVSAIMIAFTIPAVLFGSLAGVFVDRWSKKGVLVISNLLRGGLTLSIPLVLWLSQDRTLALPVYWLPTWLRHWQAQPQAFFHLPLGFLGLLVLTFIDSTITQFFAPAEQVTIPLIVKRRYLLSANSLFTTTMMAMTIIGFAIGEPLLGLAATLAEAVGLSWDEGRTAIVGGSYLIAGLILLLLRMGEKSTLYNQERPHVCEDIRDGIRYLGKNHRVRNALIQLIILFSIFAALSVLAVPLADKIPELKPEQFGFLLAACGLGMACGAGVLGHWGQQFSHSQLSLWGSFGMAWSLVGLSLSGFNLWLSLLMTAILGVFAAFVGVPMQTTIQVETPTDMRGKVFGLQNNVVNIALSLPLALAGIAETIFGLRSVLFFLAIMAIAGGLLTQYINKMDKEP